jgi:hypothetical protein
MDRPTPARTALALVSAATIALSSAAVSYGSDDRVAVGRGATTRQVDTKAFRGAINTHSRAAVSRAYKSRLAANLATRIHWTGSNRPCRAGHMSRRANAATLESINFVRAMGGLAPVSFSKRLSANAQKAALIMSANARRRGLSHDPPPSWRCWTRAGHDAAGRSNLAWSIPRITAGSAITQYMDDAGPSNIVVGHRRWVMNPPTLTMGNGMTSTTNALTVFGAATSDSRPDPAWVSWPTAGWFPAPLEPDGRWSLSAGDDGADFSHARVHVETASGAGRRAHKYPVATGYGPPTIVFDVDNVSRPGTYRVTVRGIRLPGRSTRVRHTYTVRLFQPR